ncbi:unnamed protein product [Nyctereutes procyonoides]|uniref:(raccoon dog) hypothetical protein n=1 Tax=Nyctereutes procyonoides TaxID=34880 RepID=A0A811ZLB9_NYCPR|nr:unnamed protein product [Nyctereutes procyonoides]
MLPRTRPCVTRSWWVPNKSENGTSWHDPARNSPRTCFSPSARR